MPDSAPADGAPLRIALFTGNYVHIEDGVSRTLGRLVGHLVDRGHTVMVFGPTLKDPPMDAQPGDFVAVPSIAAGFRPEYRISLGFPKAYQRRVEAFAPDIVHIATPDFLGHRALTWARERGLPVVSTYHTHFASYLEFYGVGFLTGGLWRLFRRFYNRCDEVYAPTPTMIGALRSHGVTSPIRLWPRGIELDRFSPTFRSDAWRAARGFADHEVVVSFVSRLVKEKGVDVFADAVRAVQAEGRLARVLVVGDGPEREAFERRVPNGVFLGHTSGHELSTAYASSDVFLFPSETETFGNVTLEAQASGLAVIAADAAGSRDLVADGVTGVLCPARDTAAFTDALRSLCDDADARRRLGAAARDAAADYDWRAVLNRMETYYRGVLGAGG